MKKRNKDLRVTARVFASQKKPDPSWRMQRSSVAAATQEENTMTLGADELPTSSVVAILDSALGAVTGAASVGKAGLASVGKLGAAAAAGVDAADPGPPPSADEPSSGVIDHRPFSLCDRCGVT